MIINKIKNRYILNKSDKSFINFASKYKKVKSNNSILIEAPLDDKFFLIKNFLVGKYLSEKYNFKLVYYINYNNLRGLISIFKKIYYKFVYNYFSLNYHYHQLLSNYTDIQESLDECNRNQTELYDILNDESRNVILYNSNYDYGQKCLISEYLYDKCFQQNIYY